MPKTKTAERRRLTWTDPGKDNRTGLGTDVRTRSSSRQAPEASAKLPSGAGPRYPSVAAGSSASHEGRSRPIHSPERRHTKGTAATRTRRGSESKGVGGKSRSTHGRPAVCGTTEESLRPPTLEANAGNTEVPGGMIRNPSQGKKTPAHEGLRPCAQGGCLDTEHVRDERRVGGLACA